MQLHFTPETHEMWWPVITNGSGEGQILLSKLLVRAGGKQI